AILARLGAVADGRVGARRTVGHVRVLAARGREAGVGGAGVAVVAVEGRAGGADGALARLGAVSHGGVVAGRAVGQHGELTAGRRVARVGGAGVGVVADERRAGGAHAPLTGLAPVAGVAVGARRAVGDRRVQAAADAVAGVGGARVRVVAVEARAAG